MQIEATIYFGVWWVLFEYSSFDLFPKGWCITWMKFTQDGKCQDDEREIDLFSIIVKNMGYHLIETNYNTNKKRFQARKIPSLSNKCN